MLILDIFCQASASRRDDVNLMDNFSKYTKPQLGLFHTKIAGNRCTANEHWGQPNSLSPWSLWKINSLLGRKAISAGWKAKSLPPFCPITELILTLTLPANILDAFRLCCTDSTLKSWISRVDDYDMIHQVAKKVFVELCSARRVSRLRKCAKRDIPLENIILFNRDALIMRELRSAVKLGDIGRVVNVLAHWMLMFRGSGKMPKYADALFQVLMDLKRMKPQLRYVAPPYSSHHSIDCFQECVSHELACQSKW
jgi:hypothetical protein